MQLSVFIATSLDGYIARPDGNIDWLMEASNPEDSEDYGYTEFYDSTDCLIIGRNTVDMVLTFPGEWPYEGKRVIILSTKLKEVPTALRGKAELYSGPLTDLVGKLEGEGCQRAYIDGGKTIQSFMAENLITDISITKIPIILGEGLPLFAKMDKDIKLKHLATKSYDNGFVNSTYEVL